MGETKGYEVLGIVEDEDFEVGDEFGLEDLAKMDGEAEDAEMFLDFADERPDFGEAEKRAVNALSEFSFSEILDMNEVDDAEALALLYQSGDIGLPTYVENEEVEDSESEEDEDV